MTSSTFDSGRVFAQGWSSGPTVSARQNAGVPPGQHWTARWASEPYLYLTTVGRRSGRPHRIEIWFAARDDKVYLLSGGRDRADWVRNVQTNPAVTVDLGGETHVGVARVLEPGTAQDQLARQLLVSKYTGQEEELEEWGRTSLPVVIEFPADLTRPGA